MMLLFAEYADRMPIVGIQKTLRRRHSRAGGNDGGWFDLYMQKDAKRSSKNEYSRIR